MFRSHKVRNVSVGFLFTFVILFATPMFGQTPRGPQSSNLDNKVAVAATLQPDTPASKVATSVAPLPDNAANKVGGAGTSDLEGEVAAVKAENAALREQLRKIEEQQKAVLEMLTRFQARLDAPTPGVEPTRSQQAATTAGSAAGPSDAALASVPSTGVPLTPLPATTTAGNSVPSANAVQADPKVERYRDGMVIWETPGDAKIPFLLKFNVNTQVRYLNTTSSEDTFTDHLGVVRDVHVRNDITVNRTMFILG